MFHPMIHQLIYAGCLVSGAIFTFLTAMLVAGVVLIVANGGVV